MSYDLEGQFYISHGMSLPFFSKFRKQGPIRCDLGTILENLKTTITKKLYVVEITSPKLKTFTWDNFATHILKRILDLVLCDNLHKSFYFTKNLYLLFISLWGRSKTTLTKGGR